MDRGWRQVATYLWPNVDHVYRGRLLKHHMMPRVSICSKLLGTLVMQCVATRILLLYLQFLGFDPAPGFLSTNFQILFKGINNSYVLQKPRDTTLFEAP